MYPSTKTVDEVIHEITQALCQANGDTIAEIANQLLPDQLVYLSDDELEFWVLVDYDIKRYCQTINEATFNIKQENHGEHTINLSKYREEELESCLRLYGDTFGPSQKGLTNVTERHRDKANLFIACCLYEQSLKNDPLKHTTTTLEE